MRARSVNIVTVGRYLNGRYLKIDAVWPQLQDQRYYRSKPSSTPWMLKEVTEEVVKTATSPLPPLRETPTPRRTLETNPANHTFNDVGKFYTLPEDMKNRLFRAGGIPKPFQELATVFQETAIMIRKPALEVMDCLKRTNYSKPVFRYLLYGTSGTGKSLSLCHIIHYAAVNGFVILHAPWIPNWSRWKKKEACSSETRPGLVDVPMEGAIMLKHFQLQNSAALQNPELVTSNDYVWNQREMTPAGSPLLDLITHGISRVKYSCDCLDALVKELKMLATQGKCRLLVVADGWNGIYTPHSNLKIEDGTYVAASRVSMSHTFRDAIKMDWSNGAVILTISTRCEWPDRRESDSPMYLLRKNGIEEIDPFIPIKVPPLTDEEFQSLMDYYEDRRWISKPGVREEIAFLTTRIAGEIMYYCRHL